MKKMISFLLFTYLFALNLPHNFSAAFIQTINNNGQKIIYKGKIFYKDSNIFWKYIYPVEKNIWINDKIYIYEPDLQQITISKRPKFTLQNIIKNAKKLKKNEYETEINRKKVYFIYEKSLKKLWYKDDVGNLITVRFFNQSNKQTDNLLFIPKYPKNIDIIYQR